MSLTERAIEILDKRIEDAKNYLIWADFKERYGDLKGVEYEINDLKFLRKELLNRLNKQK